MALHVCIQTEATMNSEMDEDVQDALSLLLNFLTDFVCQIMRRRIALTSPHPWKLLHTWHRGANS
jgi:hypothetical protein